MYNSKQFNVKFRENKTIIASVLNNKITDKDFILLYLPLKRKSNDLKPIINDIILKQKKDISTDSLVSSYIHMMLNRLFRSKNSMHELVLYDFMYRYYKSEIAKEKFVSVSK